MSLKPASLAGWCLSLLLLFLSAFYIVSGGLLKIPEAWGPRISIAVIEAVAFLGIGVFFKLFWSGKKSKRRLRSPTHVYTSFGILTAITAGLGIFLLYAGAAWLTGRDYIGIFGFYPMLAKSMGIPPVVTIVTLAAVPAIVQEWFLRGRLFSLFERHGTLAAVLLSALCLPMLYVHPQAAPGGLWIGVICGLLTYYTSALWPAILAHFSCRLFLYIGNLIYGLDFFSGHEVYCVIAAAVLFLLFLFSLLRCVEGLLSDGLLAHFEKRGGDAENGFSAFVKAPGFLLFFLLYITRLVMVLL